MSERPILSTNLDADIFLQYYYLKEELSTFCRENNLCVSGGKQDLTKRIDYYLRTGKKSISFIEKRNNITNSDDITLDSVIENNFICSEKHRAFFCSVIGASFSFNVTFQKYLKTNAGKTYAEAVNEWYHIREDKKRNKGSSQIDSQFEYNTYIRDFFNDNKNKTLNDAIKCWNYKKGTAGHNKYEGSDLTVLSE